MSQLDLRGLRVCLIGASGFIGRHTLSALHRARAEIICVSRRPPSHHPGQANWISGNIQDETTISAAVKGMDAVIYLASASLPASANNQMASDVRQHVYAPVRTAEVAITEGVRKFIFASSGGTIYGPIASASVGEESPLMPLTAYAVSKLAVEQYLQVMHRLFHLGVRSLRIANPYGEHQTSERGQGFVSAAMKAAVSGQPLVIWGDGAVIRDYVYVGDVANAFLHAIIYEGAHTVFNVGSGVGRTLLEIVALVESVTGRSIDIRLESERAIDVPVNVLEISRARQELHWFPEIDIIPGLHRTYDWWSSQTTGSTQVRGLK